MKGTVRTFLLVTLVAVMFACGRGELPDQDRVTRADSSGVTIVTSHAPAEAEAGWRVSAEPRVTIGVMDGDPGQQLFGVNGASVLSDGRIAVGNGGTSEIRFYDTNGSFLARKGGDGEGPGEFRAITALHRLPGDSLLVWDGRLGRVTVLAPDGSLVRTFQLQPPGPRSFPRLQNVFRDGSLLVTVPMLSDRVPEDLEVRQTDLLYMRYSRNGTPLDSLGQFPTAPALYRTLGDGFIVARIPFRASTLVVPGEDHLFVSPGGEIQRLRLPGLDPDLIIRTSTASIPVSADLIERQLEADWSEAPTDEIRQLVLGSRDVMPVPESVPRFDRLEVDRGGRVWARRWALPGDATSDWSVFASEGGWLTDVEFPAGARLLDIGDAYVLVRGTDELDVERIMLFEIERTGSAP